MQEKRRIRLGKWLLKVAASYAVFWLIGRLLAAVPAWRFGLSEPVFQNLRMFFVLFGPIYLTFLAKIVLVVLGAVRKPYQDTGTAEKSRGILYAVTALLLFANLSNAQTAADLAAGTVSVKGLRNLGKSRRYPLKGRRFLNVFLPLALYLLALEILTLFVCIVTFAPLSRAASNAFLLLIGLTILLLVLVPMVFALVSGYQGDQAEQEEKRAKERQEAIQSDQLVLETDPKRRKQYLRLPKRLTLLVCPGVFIGCGIVLYLTRDLQDLLEIRLLRQPVLMLAAAALFSILPLLLYWANCSGTSLVQRIYLAQDHLYYTGYSGSMEERVEFTFALLCLEHYRVGKRAIYLRGQFTKKTKDASGTRQTGPFAKTLWIPRTFPPEQEQALLQYLQERLSG